MKNRKPKADGRYVVNVSFTANETSLLAWADKHGNFSTYIKKLIEADMSKTGITNGIPAEMFQAMMMNIMGQSNLKDIIQNKGVNEISATVESPESPQEDKKPKLNKSAIGNIMKKKK